MTDLGFSGGRVLEPGSGMGTFIGVAPDRAQMTGVELDQTTAALASHLYPEATIRAEGFEETRFPDETFDVSIGNVPFANVALHDKAHNARGYAIHNHFILKSLNLTRPGGLAAFITSSYTLDAQESGARRDMYAQADLLGAIRLPSTAHKRSAGTEALTDILIFRKRLEGEEPGPDGWLHSDPVVLEKRRESVPTGARRVNRHFDENPSMVLGTMLAGQGVNGSPQVVVTPHEGPPLEEQLQGALSSVVTAAQTAGLTMSPRGNEEGATPAVQLPEAPPASIRWDGHIAAAGEDFIQYLEGNPEPLQVPKDPKTRRELRALLELRDIGTSLLEMESATVGDDPEVSAQRDRLRAAWQAYQDTYGPINRFRESWRTSSTGKEFMVPVYPSAAKLFRTDPFAPFVNALERFDADTQTARPADILSGRALSRRETAQSADNIRDALAITLDTTGTVDLDMIARLRDASPEDARAELGTLVYDDPQDGRLVTATEYLSGDSRAKLAAAEEAAARDPERYTANVIALEGIIPEDLTAAEIEPQIGAVWIPAEDHRQFLIETLGLNPGQLELSTIGDGTWQVKQQRISAMKSASVTWGTERRNAVELFVAMAEQRPILIYDTLDDGTRVLNATETEAAKEKAEELSERFQDWVWEDPDRASRLTRAYNETFNSLVLRDYREAGEMLTFPGMAETFSPRPHQRTAVARMINEPAVGLFHQVGAGKTAEMVIGCMELKRLGMVNKPAIVVPNHMLEQFSREFLEIYPGARLLAAGGGDLDKKNRRAFLARITNNEWDTVVMTRGAFQKLDLQPENKAAFIRTELEELRTAAAAAKESGSELSIKALEKKIQRAEQRLRKTLDQDYDPGITFEATGIDYLAIDEAHDFKNLETASNIRGAAIDGSDRAMDLKMKVDYLRSQHGARVATFATGTPIANSVAEAFVMQKYLRPDLLDKAGLRSFDAWAATFGKTVMNVEMAPEGGSFRMVQRFAQFQNVPELLRMMHTYADVKMADDLNLPVPLLTEQEADGKRGPTIAAVPASQATVDYIATLGPRAERIRAGQVDPRDDNMLRVSHHGRSAALNTELVGIEDPEAEIGKVAQAARTIADIYHDTKHNEYETDGGTLTPGALQIVFSDLHAASDYDYDAYTDLRERLIDGGIPADRIRFMQDAKNDRDKAALFADCRNGKVAVLIGSTQTMGTGTNVQRRAIALHHLDCPWRPADVEQREGRILRQGNANDNVSIYRWITQKSFDAYMWQTVERKARFIDQIMRGTLDVRTIEDLGENSLGYGVVAAVAADNPLMIEQAKLKGEVQRLARLERAHEREQQNLRIQIPDMRAGIETMKANQEVLAQIAATTQDTSGTNFTMDVQGASFRERAKAAVAIGQWAQQAELRSPWDEPRSLGQIGTLAGQPIHATIIPMSESGQPPYNPRLHLHVPGTLEKHAVAINADDLKRGEARVVTSLEARIAAIGRDAEGFATQLPKRERELQEAESNLGKPFKHAHQLTLTRRQLEDVESAMAKRESSKAAPSADTPALMDAPSAKAPSYTPVQQRPRQHSHGAAHDTSYGR